MNLSILSAGAGSGKTYSLTAEMVRLIDPDQDGKVKASGIIATTFTNKAAAELMERVRSKLLENGLASHADQLSSALIGTVHGVGVRLLKRFAFEAGVSPNVNIIAEEDQQLLFNQSLAAVLSNELMQKMEDLAEKLGLNKNVRYDWREEVKRINDVARANNFDLEDLQNSSNRSIRELFSFLPEEDARQINWESQLKDHLQNTSERSKKMKILPKNGESPIRPCSVAQSLAPEWDFKLVRMGKDR